MITPQDEREQFAQQIKREALAAIALLGEQAEDKAEFDLLVGYLEAVNDPGWWIEQKWAKPEGLLRIASRRREHTGEM